METELKLVLKGKWYDLIESGIKTEEYREIKDYWCKRIKGFAYPCPYSLISDVEGERMCQMKAIICPSGIKPKYTTVRFQRGYTKKYMRYEILSMRVGKGNPEWGAPEDKPVFILTLGKRLPQTEE